jgi:hypothetical protein
MKIQLNTLKSRVKSLAFTFTLTALMFCAIDTKAETAAVSKSNIEAFQSDQSKADQMMNRLTEIRLMDHSKMSPPQRKTLKKELQSMKKKFQSLDGGIYISAGAIIIILLLIIILF